MSLCAKHSCAADTPAKPVRVVHILEATEGGTRRWLENALLNLESSLVQQACICAVRRDAAFLASVERFRERGVEVWTVDMRRGINPLSDFRAIREVHRILVDHRFDIVHAHSSKAGFIGRAAARLAGQRPVVYSPHAYAFLAGGVSAPIFYLAEVALQPWADMLLAVSESEAEFSRQIGFPPAKIRIIRNGVRPEAYTPVGLGERSSQRTVGTVTSFRPQKDSKTFLNACALLHKYDKSLHFVACGAGRQLGQAKRTAERLALGGQVEFTGWVDDIPARIASWDVFVLATHFEGLSFALLEAMAAGLPIVASRAPGVEEVIVHGETGLLVPPDDPEALAEAARQLLEQPLLAERMGKAARETCTAQFSLQTQLDLLTNLYCSLMKGNSTPDVAQASI